tara:strand:- start:1413 stop:2291 length:879 start_codon:yes stop_codon:yes gene_type:complete
MKITNQYNLPQIVVDALVQDDYTKGQSNRSVTQLIDSPRVAILQREHEDEMSQDVVDFLWSRFGTSVHGMFEKAVEGTTAVGVVSEERLYAEVEGWTVSGAIDLQELHDDGVLVSDYKVTSVWSVIHDKTEWHNQLNAYAWLVRSAKDLPVKGLRIIAILRDWQRRKAQMEPDYPASPIHMVDIPMWSVEETNQYILDRVLLHQEAEFDRMTGGALPLCTSAERWEKPTTFAVNKKGRKRAVRVLASREEAEDYLKSLGKDHLVEERVGESTRCAQDWCRVARWCDQNNLET